ncbi:MAG: FtsX-like permease family protein [Solobacterium sp.]|nr:FtsX-like permease family protein [Solobacterium sp.]
MPRRLWTNLWRMVKTTKSRFFSLTAIVALGVAFFIGVSASSPVMGKSVDIYNDETGLKDITVYSNYGFDQDDIDALNEQEDVLKAEGTRFMDVIGVCGNETYVTRVHAYDPDHEINGFVLREGRLPQNEHEALAECGTTLEAGFALGSEVELITEEEDPVLLVDRVTVVGLIDTPLYLNMTKENSTLNNQYLRTYLYVPYTAFDPDYYTEVNILLKAGKEMYAFSDRYEDYAAEAKEKLEAFAKEQERHRYQDLKDEALEEYNDGLQEYEDGKKEFDEKIADAQEEIADAEEEIRDGENEIAKGKRDLEKAQKDLDQAFRDGKKKIRDAMGELVSGEKELQDQEKQVKDNKAMLLQKKKEAEDGLRQIRDGLEKMDEAIAGLDQIEDGEKQINDALEQISAFTVPDTLPDDMTVGEIKGLADGITEGLDELPFETNDDTTVGELRTYLADTAQQLQEQKEQLARQKADILQQLDAETTEEAREKRAGVEAQKKTVEDALKQIDDGLKQMDQAIAGLEAIEEGETQIQDALNKMSGYTIPSSVPDAMTVGQLKQYAPDIIDLLAELPMEITDDTTVGEIRAYLTSAVQELNNQKAQLEQQKAAILSQLGVGNIAQAKEKRAALEAQKAPLEEALAQIKAGLDQMDQAIAGLEAIEAGEQQIRDALDQLAAFDIPDMLADDMTIGNLKELSSGFTEALQDLPMETDDDTTIGEIRDYLSSARSELNKKKKELADTKAGILKQMGVQDTAQAKKKREELAAQKKTVEDGLVQINDALNQIAEGEEKITAGKEDLEKGKKEIREAENELNEKVSDGQDQIDDGWQEIRENEDKIADGKQELADAKQELEDAIADGEKELSDAWDELTDAKEQIDSMEEPEWTVLDRTSHYASATYSNTVDQMNAIGNLFPIFFILVAALVCLTTMTRMVDEQRGEIGVLRALGFTRLQCAAKYLLYAAFATLLGEAIGTVAGMLSFPIIIYNTWKLMYILPKIFLYIPWNLVAMADISFLGIMLLATWLACRADMRETPAQLLRPKAPKLGKNTLLEKIPFLWKHLSFTWKVTIRNIIRYKRRFIMTVAGVAGCSALLVTGFGIRDSINAMVDIQFYTLYQYEGTALMKDDVDSARIQEIQKDLEQDPEAERISLLSAYSAKAKSPIKEETAYLQIYPEADMIKDTYLLRTRKKHEPMELKDSGVIISEKLAENLGVKKGDKITVESREGAMKEITVTDICEMYVRHYIFMSEKCYKDTYGEDVLYDTFFIKLKNGQKGAQTFQKKLLNYKEIDSVEFYDVLLDNFTTMVKGLDFIVWAILISSMSLAFIVLSNLINVNISERQREIATLKVLGFHAREVQSYIYKENNILTVIGAFCGIPMGILLHHYIMRMVEMEYIMFGREVLFPSYVYAVLLTVLFGILVNHFMKRKLSAITMVESLKSVE